MYYFAKKHLSSMEDDQLYSLTSDLYFSFMSYKENKTEPNSDNLFKSFLDLEFFFSSQKSKIKFLFEISKDTKPDELFSLIENYFSSLENYSLDIYDQNKEKSNYLLNKKEILTLNYILFKERDNILEDYFFLSDKKENLDSHSYSEIFFKNALSVYLHRIYEFFFPQALSIASEKNKNNVFYNAFFIFDQMDSFNYDYILKLLKNRPLIESILNSEEKEKLKNDKNFKNIFKVIKFKKLSRRLFEKLEENHIFLKEYDDFEDSEVKYLFPKEKISNF